jgi:hypothetical protein
VLARFSNNTINFENPSTMLLLALLPLTKSTVYHKPSHNGDILLDDHHAIGSIDRYWKRGPIVDCQAQSSRSPASICNFSGCAATRSRQATTAAT